MSMSPGLEGALALPLDPVLPLPLVTVAESVLVAAFTAVSESSLVTESVSSAAVPSCSEELKNCHARYTTEAESATKSGGLGLWVRIADMM